MEFLVASHHSGAPLHHAYLIEGDRESVLESLLRFVTDDLGMATRGNPDFHQQEFETFGIDDGRRIEGLASKKSISGGRQVFVLATTFMTTEAQNALLKLLEEPKDGTHFFILVPSHESVLPTVRSRMLLLSLKDAGMGADRARQFLTADVATRLELLTPIIDEKNKAGALSFLNELEAEITKQQKIPGGDMRHALAEIERCRGYLNDRAPSVKMLLEYIAGIVPREASKNP